MSERRGILEEGIRENQGNIGGELRGK